MLVLARRVGERICIGNGIVITLIAARGDRARIGIEAPASVVIDREEVRHRKDLENAPMPRTVIVESAVPANCSDISPVTPAK